MKTVEELAQSAYVAYGAVTDFKNFRGEPMPIWNQLPVEIQDAWRAAVNRILVEIDDE